MGHCGCLHLLRVTFAVSSLFYLLWGFSCLVVVVDVERQQVQLCYVCKSCTSAESNTFGERAKTNV